MSPAPGVVPGAGPVVASVARRGVPKTPGGSRRPDAPRCYVPGRSPTHPPVPAVPPRPAQLARLRPLLAAARSNPFYAPRLAGFDPATFAAADFGRLPFTTKAELVADQARHPPYGSNRSGPAAAFTRLHQSSGTTTGKPLRWLDTPESWDWLLHCWHVSFPLMGLTAADRAFFPFSFGPFLGFWSAFEAAVRHGGFCLSGGGMTTTGRVQAVLDHAITVVFATPTYALHLAEVAARDGIDLAGSAVRAVVVAGEPGGGEPGTRSRIERGWGARVFDHYGLTEVGPVAVEVAAAPGSLVVLETEYVAEILAPGTPDPVPPGAVGELVLTNLGRTGSPLIRYRTGDLVKADPDPRAIPGVPDWLRLSGGVVGRADDMLHVRGNNLYPGAIEAIVRRFDGVAEYRVEVTRAGGLADVRIAVEPRDPAAGPGLADAVGRAVRDSLLFRAAVVVVPAGSLPRFELKARRVVIIDSPPAAGLAPPAP